MSFSFIVDPEVTDLGVRVLGVEIDGIDNHEQQPEYLEWKQKKVRELLDRYTGFDVKTDPILQGFYELHAKVGVPRRKNIPASENLIRLLIKKQGIFSINKAVDIYNIISLDSKLALGAHDIDHVSGNITLRLTDGTENFIPLGQTEPKPVKPGEYSYIDDSNDIVCWLEIRQIDKDKITEDTRNVFYIVQGNEHTPDELLKKTAEDLITVTERFCGGTGRILNI